LHQYWAASNPKVDVGVSVKPAKRVSLLEARPAEFCVQQLGRHYHGAAVAGLLREAMKLSGVDLKLPGWCAPLPLSPACFLPQRSRLGFLLTRALLIVAGTQSGSTSPGRK